MARKRMIDPSIWEDEDIGVMSDGAFRLFVGLFSRADDYGRLPASAQALKRGIFGFAQTTTEQIEGYLVEVRRACRHVAVYEVDGRRFITLLKWGTYQNLHKPQPSVIPQPPGWQWVDLKRSSQYASGEYKPASDNTQATEEPLSDAVEPGVNPAPTQVRVEEKKREEEKEKKKRAGKAVDSPSPSKVEPESDIHPGRAVFRDVFKQQPLKDYFDAFDEQYELLGADEMRHRLEWWKGHGWKPTNYLGILEVLRNGCREIPRGAKEPTGPSVYEPTY